MEKEINTITFCPDHYKEYFESLRKEDVNDVKMNDDIQAFVRIALKNNYQLKVYSDSYCTVIEYAHADPSLSDTRLEWVNEEESVENEADTEWIS